MHLKLSILGVLAVMAISALAAPTFLLFTTQNITNVVNATDLDVRQVISPWPHFRECRKNDPRPYCPRFSSVVNLASKTELDKDTSKELNDTTTTDKLNTRQVISPWPHFRECRKNDPRPYCPRIGGVIDSRSSLVDGAGSDEGVVEGRQVSPWPHFRECRKNDPRPYCPRVNTVTGKVEDDVHEFWATEVGQQEAERLESLFEALEGEE